MRPVTIACLVVVLLAPGSESGAGCNCEDWIGKGGYCVDYIKSRIPAFPVPYSIQAIKILKNEEVDDIRKGDVTLFTVSNYWHTAYVEKVHFDRQGNPFAIDVSEMNYGEQPSYDEFISRWGLVPEREWQRALCCGITKNFGLVDSRKGIPLSDVHQVWSPPSLFSRFISKLFDNLEIDL